MSGWDVSKVTNMNSLFVGATSANPNVSSWDVSKVTDMNGMFFNASDANPDMSSWNVSAVTDMGFMFKYSDLSTANYDALLINLADNNTLVTGVTLGASTIKYSSNDAETAQNTLENDRGWTINDAGDATP